MATLLHAINPIRACHSTACHRGDSGVHCLGGMTARKTTNAPDMKYVAARLARLMYVRIRLLDRTGTITGVGSGIPPEEEEEEEGAKGRIRA